MTESKKRISLESILLLGAIVILLIAGTIDVYHMDKTARAILETPAKDSYYGVDLDDLWKCYDTYVPANVLNVNIENVNGEYVYIVDGVNHSIPIEQMPAVMDTTHEHQIIVSSETNEAISKQNYMLEDGTIKNFTKRVANNEKTNNIPLNLAEYKNVQEYSNNRNTFQKCIIVLLTLAMLLTFAVVALVVQKDL